MEIATTRLERPYTDLMPKEVFIFLIYAACFAMPPGSALVNFVIASLWQWRSQVSHTARLLPGLYINLEKQPSFKMIIDRYKELKSKKKQGLVTLEERKELNQIKHTIEEVSPKPRLLLARYRLNWLVGAAVLAFTNYQLYRLFPDPMRLLFGETIWQRF